MKRRVFRLISWLGGGSQSLSLGGIGLIALVCVARMAGFLEVAELKSLDFLLKWRPAEATDERITILEIDESDIQEIGAYPVPDDVLTELLSELQSYKPRLIGLDMIRDVPVINPHTEGVQAALESPQGLKAIFENSENLIAIENFLSNPPVSAPLGVPPERVGFTDVILDEDESIRRDLLGSPGMHAPSTYHFSLSFQLASRYLNDEGFELDAGRVDKYAMRFGDAELFRLDDTSGGYVKRKEKDNTGGNPIVLINVRSGKNPFERISFTQFKAANDSDKALLKALLTDRIVLIGTTAPTAGDIVDSSAGRVAGVELLAHMTSQVISATLDNRPILKTIPAGWEYLFIVAGGFLGLSLIHFKRSIPVSIAAFVAMCFLPLGLGYGLIFAGFWFPLFPVGLIVFINGSSSTIYKISQYEHSWKVRIDERQRIIEKSYNTIHNGPLQTLKYLSRRVNSKEAISNEAVGSELSSINHEIRSIYEFMKREYLSLDRKAYLYGENVIDLEHELHLLLYQLFRSKIDASSGLQKIEFMITDFSELRSDHLSLEDREDIIRFLEEALCNVEQHASGVTRLHIICQQQDGKNVVRVIDNGTAKNLKAKTAHKGRGTKHAEALALRLGGYVSRHPHTPTGKVYELVWPFTPPPVWMVSLRWMQKTAKEFNRNLH